MSKIIKTYNISEENAMKLEMISRILGKAKSQIVNDLISEDLIISSVLCQGKIEEILAVIEEKQKKILKE